MKRVLFWVFVGLLLAATVFGLVRRPAERPIPVYAARAKKTTFVREVSADGHVHATRLRLAFSTPGRIVEVRRAQGDRVEKGETIARIEDRDARRRLALAEARLRAFEREFEAQENARLARKKRLLEKRAALERKLDLTRALLAAGAASRAELEDLKDALAENARALAELESERTQAAAQAEAQRAELKANLEAAREALKETRLVAPADGTLEALPFKVGELARGEAVLVVEGSLSPYARFAESEAAGLKAGLPARIELESQPGRSYPTRVARVLPPEREGDAAWVPLLLDPPKAAPLAPDLTLTAYVEVERIENAVVVPLEALVEEKGRVYVWTIENRRAKKLRVEKLAQNLTQAAVAGLAPGTPVVRLPPEKLKEGARLAPTFEEDDAGGR